MCPLFPVHLILMYATVLIPIWLVYFSSAAEPSLANNQHQSYYELTPAFYPDQVSKLVEGTTQEVFWSLTAPENFADIHGDHFSLYEDPIALKVESSDRQIADVTSNTSMVYLTSNETSLFQNGGSFNFSFSVTGKFLGHAFIKVSMAASNVTNKAHEIIQPSRLPVSVVRKDTVLDKIFLYSVIGLVSLAYINMGCSLDLKVVWETIRRPVGPLVGITCQYLCMPLLAFGLARLVLPSPSLQLGLFVTGCSPGGGASNIWTVLLNGNINLSITLTFVSTVLALALMPAWIFSLGRVIFDQANLRIPYKNIIYLIIGLLVPVSIGVLIRKRCPKLADGLVKLTRPFSLLLIVYIFTFGIYANVYVFYLITWEVVLSSVCLIWFGFTFGYVVARCLKFNKEDIIAIAIETGIQNTGVAILLLKLSLPQPDADMTFVLPIMAATAMPIPLSAILGWLKLREWWTSSGSISLDHSRASMNGNGLMATNGKSSTVESFFKTDTANHGPYVPVSVDEEEACDFGQRGL